MTKEERILRHVHDIQMDISVLMDMLYGLQTVLAISNDEDSEFHYDFSLQQMAETLPTMLIERVSNIHDAVVSIKKVC